MEKLFVKTQTTEYPIYIEDSFDCLKKAFEEAKLAGRKAVIVCDSNTERIYLDKIKSILEECLSEVYSISFLAGEESKNLDVINSFYKFFIDKKLDRKSVVVALGGGVVGDMAGFAAATFMRGISFVQIPTTLLAQVDSSVGGKVGVDFLGNKNMIGAFYQPKFVYINSDTLKTLPKKEFNAGMAEVIKYGYIIDSDYLDIIIKEKEQIKMLDTKSIQKIIYGACKSKAYVVSVDEKESGLREILNFGHTFGHAVESLSEFKLIHGECVSIGMIAALYFSMKRGAVKETDLKNAEELLKFFDLPIRVKEFDCDKIYRQMFFDKKNKDNKINLVLLSKIGKAYTEKSAYEAEIKEAVGYIVN